MADSTMNALPAVGYQQSFSGAAYQQWPASTMMYTNCYYHPRQAIVQVSKLSSDLTSVFWVFDLALDFLPWRSIFLVVQIRKNSVFPSGHPSLGNLGLEGELLESNYSNV